MANLLSLLNERICRVARREVRGQIQKTRRLTARHRRDLAALKRQVAALARTVAFLEKQEQRRVASPPVLPEAGFEAAQARFDFPDFRCIVPLGWGGICRYVSGQ